MLHEISFPSYNVRDEVQGWIYVPAQKPVTNRSLYDFTQMMLCITGKEWAEKVPKQLPIYNIGGDQDPVGEYGKGIYEVTNWLYDTGHHVKTHVYPGYRHEIHNYDCLKDEVEQRILDFMDEYAF